MAKPRLSVLFVLALTLVVVMGVFGPLLMYQTVEENDRQTGRAFPGDTPRRINHVSHPLPTKSHERSQPRRQEKLIVEAVAASKALRRPQEEEEAKEQPRPQHENSSNAKNNNPPLNDTTPTFPDNDELHQYEQFATKASYDPALNPVFSSIRKIKTRFVSQKITSGKVKHVFLEGMEKSDYIDLVKISSLPPNETYQDYGEELWIDDSPFKSTCTNTEAFAKLRQNKSVMVLQLDYKDFERMGYCEHLHEYVGGRQNIRYAKRSLVEGRQYNYTDNGWIDHGHFRVNDGANFTGGPTIHAPYTVRTDQVELILSSFWNESWPGAYPDKKWDVAHFWSVGNDPVSHLRNQVTGIIKSMKGMELPNGKKMRCFANLAGNRGTKGRKGIQERYVELMLKSKIIVVTQRDPWEGHYRLMEALASGAMVVADLMLSLPKGLKDRKSVVLFRNEAELREVLQYYVQREDERIQIARKGWEIVMSRHRAWHRLEELLFGRPLTDVDNPYGPYKKQA